MFHDKLITNEKIKKGKRIGNGQFGEVYKGNISLRIISFERQLKNLSPCYKLPNKIPNILQVHIIVQTDYERLQLRFQK